MKKTLTTMAVCAALTFCLSACSGKKDKNTIEKAVTEVAQKVAAEIKFDTEGIKALVNKGKEDMLEKDYDFVLDQLEIYVNKIEKMSPEEIKQYLAESPDSEYIMVLGLASVGAYKQDLFTPAQKTRYEALMARGEKAAGKE